MTILEKVKKSFEGCPIGTIFSRSEIISMVVNRQGCNSKSIIPSDYCYNRINNGIDFDNYLHIFEYTEGRQYKYLGEGFLYNGKILHNPKGGYEIIVGEWKDGKVVSNANNVAYITMKDIAQTNLNIHKTKREVSVKLRFEVLKRDNFKCCACGASPAKDPSVELHVDHIIPWSKGGETEKENLQTLCSKCNLGKSDIV